MYLQFAGNIVIFAARVGDEFTRYGRNLVIGQVGLAKHGQSLEVLFQLGDIVVRNLKDFQAGQQSLQTNNKN